MARFYPVTVTSVRHTTRDAVVLTLQPDEPEAFGYLPGQYLTFRRKFDGEELRRSYSICTGLDDGVLEVGIRRVEGGAFSTWANAALKPGERLEAMAPAGNFHVKPAPEAARHYLAFAGGSGITPVLSILRAAMSREPKSRFTLVYANRAVPSVMFREEIEDLKNRHLGRLSVVHVLEHGSEEIELFSGLVDEAKCAALLDHWIDIASVHTAFICGPEPMMLGIARALRAHGLDEGRVKFELFASPRPRRATPAVAPAPAAGDEGCALTVTLDGTAHRVAMAGDGQTILEAALAADIDAPFACRAGVCSTCRARVLEGEVAMAANHALEDYEVAQGYVLTCQSTPLTGRVAVDYDQ